MSLQLAAKHLASKGRGDDKMLVHMTPKEVAGLQALAMKHGGSLTINPDTGLPEAGFLKNILPMVAGIAGAAMGMPVWAMPALVGGGTALATGSLGRGLLAGLGAYGGANIGAGLMGAGTEAAMASAAAGMEPSIWAGAGTEAGSQAIADQLIAAQVAAQASPLATMGNGLGFFAENPMAALKAGATAIDPTSDWKAAGKAGAALAPFLPGLMAPTTAMPLGGQAGAGSTFNPRPARYDANFVGGDPNMTSREKQWMNPRYTYDGFADGGPVSDEERLRRAMPVIYEQAFPQFASTSLGRQLSNPAAWTVTKMAGGGKVGLENGGFVVPADVVSALGNGSSSAGLETLAKKIGAKPIHGPGDGMSDSIPTTIEGKHRAAVARDEAYVPPEQVQKAGGAKKLYSMMDRVRKQAHGKTSQQRKVNPEKLVAA